MFIGGPIFLLVGLIFSRGGKMSSVLFSCLFFAESQNFVLFLWNNLDSFYRLWSDQGASTGTYH